GVPRGVAHTHNRRDERDERDSLALELEHSAPLHLRSDAESVHHHSKRERVPPRGEQHESQETESHKSGGAHVALVLGRGLFLVLNFACFGERADAWASRHIGYSKLAPCSGGT